MGKHLVLPHHYDVRKRDREDDGDGKGDEGKRNKTGTS